MLVRKNITAAASTVQDQSKVKAKAKSIRGQPSNQASELYWTLIDAVSDVPGDSV